jgi:hypothetical protein
VHPQERLGFRARQKAIKEAREKRRAEAVATARGKKPGR